MIHILVVELWLQIRKVLDSHQIASRCLSCEWVLVSWGQLWGRKELATYRIISQLSIHIPLNTSTKGKTKHMNMPKFFFFFAVLHLHRLVPLRTCPLRPLRYVTNFDWEVSRAMAENNLYAGYSPHTFLFVSVCLLLRPSPYLALHVCLSSYIYFCLSVSACIYLLSVYLSAYTLTQMYRYR